MRRISAITAAASSASETVVLSPLARFLTWHSPAANSRSPAMSGDAEAAAVGVLELLAELLGFGIDLDAEAGGAQLRGQSEVVAEAGGVEVGDEDLGRRARPARSCFELFHRGQQAIEAERRADAGQLLLRVELGQVVVAAAAADAADRRAGRRASFRGRCRCSSRGRGRSTTSSCTRSCGTPAAATAASSSASRSTPSLAALAAGDERSQLRRASASFVPASCDQLDDVRRLLGRSRRPFAAISSATLSGPILASLSSARSTSVDVLGEAERFAAGR